ncbi:hypothetical protein SDC9_200050 [bioreactor metagenome]|uniref:Uncharacterized protein n=1 Tax=bioreactor metagenome TaxID=1076179 RepID=A0A645IPQ0_9ZZZZ
MDHPSAIKYFFVKDAFLICVDKEIELHNPGIDIAIQIHNHGFGTTVKQAA